MPLSPPPGRALAWCLVVAGWAATAWAVAGRMQPPRVPAGAVALVEGVPLSRSTYEAMAAALAEDLGRSLTPEERRHVLDRLIDEELLFQRALDMGLVRRDRRLKSRVVDTLLRTLLEGAAAEPGEDELRAYYEANLGRFAPPAMRRIDVLRAPDQGGDCGTAVVEVPPADRPPSLVGLSPEPVGRRRAAGLVGEPLAACLFGPGATTCGPWRGGELALCFRSTPVAAPPVSFDEVRPLVLAAWRRDRDDRRLRAYLDQLRSQARIAVAPAPAADLP